MKRSNSIVFVAAIMALAAAACKKVINVDLNNADPHIVIEGEVTNQPGPYQVKITNTVNFSARNNYPPVSGATVTITDSTVKRTFTLSETSPGIYTTNQ